VADFFVGKDWPDGFFPPSYFEGDEQAPGAMSASMSLSLAVTGAPLITASGASLSLSLGVSSAALTNAAAPVLAGGGDWTWRYVPRAEPKRAPRVVPGLMSASLALVDITLTASATAVAHAAANARLSRLAVIGDAVGLAYAKAQIRFASVNLSAAVQGVGTLASNARLGDLVLVGILNIARAQRVLPVQRVSVVNRVGRVRRVPVTARVASK